MPVGLAIMKWDERIGVDVLARYPEDITITDKTLMQIYSTHEYTGEQGMISLTVGSLNVASYYTGAEVGIYFIMLMNLDEDPDSFEDGMADAARLIVTNIDNNAFLPLIPSLFQRLSVYPTLNDERKLAMLLTDEVKRMVITRLQDEGSLLKSEIAVWLRDQFKEGFVDVDGIILNLIKESIVKSRSVKGSPSEVIYLINDIFITRTPPIKILKDSTSRGLPEQLITSYTSDIKNFFNTYKVTTEDNLILLETILDPPVYETLTLLRQAIVTRDDLEKLQKKGVDDVDYVLKKLWEAKMIVVLQDDAGNEYYGLQSDLKILKIFPSYNLNLLRNQHTNKIKSTNVLLENVDALKDQFRNIPKNAMVIDLSEPNE